VAHRICLVDRHTPHLTHSCLLHRETAVLAPRAAAAGPVPLILPANQQMFSTVFEKLAGEPAWQKILDK